VVRLVGPDIIGTDDPEFIEQTENLKVVQTIADWPTTTELTIRCGAPLAGR